MSDHRVLTAILRTDLSSFIQKVFATVSPGDIYRHGWHIDTAVPAPQAGLCWSYRLTLACSMASLAPMIGPLLQQAAADAGRAAP